jgi:hypothetical protein
VRQQRSRGEEPLVDEPSDLVHHLPLDAEHRHADLVVLGRAGDEVIASSSVAPAMT